MLDVGVSGKFLFCIGTTSIFSGEFVNIKLTYQYTTGKYGKVGSSYFWHCQCLFLMFWVNSWFSVGSYGNAESSWAQVWRPPSLGHWWLQEQYWYFSRKLCRGHFFLSGTFWLWWRVLWTREPSCPTMEWPRNENQLQLCVNNWVLSKTNAELSWAKTVKVLFNVMQKERQVGIWVESKSSLSSRGSIFGFLLLCAGISWLKTWL